MILIKTQIFPVAKNLKAHCFHLPGNSFFLRVLPSLGWEWWPRDPGVLAQCPLPPGPSCPHLCDPVGAGPSYSVPRSGSQFRGAHSAVGFLLHSQCCSVNVKFCFSFSFISFCFAFCRSLHVLSAEFGSALPPGLGFEIKNRKEVTAEPSA